MDRSSIQAIHEQYRETQSLILHIVESLPAHQWNNRTALDNTPLAFHVWHIAREADLLHAALRRSMNQSDQQIWDRDRIASRWALPLHSLGLLESGIGMDESDAANISWPSGAALLAYLQQAFDAVNETIMALEITEIRAAFDPCIGVLFGGAGTVESAIMRAIASSNRHLGVIGWISASSHVRSQEIFSRTNMGSHGIATVTAPIFVTDN